MKKTQQLKVTSIVGIRNQLWKDRLHPGSVVDVVSETKVHFIIKPLGFEQKVLKSKMNLSGFPAKDGVYFEVVK